MSKSAHISNPDTRARLLDDLAHFAMGGTAEQTAQTQDDTFFRTHLPIREHRRVLDRDTMLILGGRGTGKTQLFDALRRLREPSQLALETGRRPVSGPGDTFVAGYTATRTTRHPRTEVLQQCIGDEAENKAPSLWVGMLAGVILQTHEVRDCMTDCLKNEVVEKLTNSLAAPGNWLAEVDNNVADVHLALDRVDESLRGQNRYLYVTYDDLDILAAQVTHVYPLIRELLAFWLRNARRWGHLRCKIFLRTDIFDADELAFTDRSKLRPRSVTLRWTPDNLYRLVLKRLINGESADAWKRFLGSVLSSDRVTRSEPWGLVPTTSEKEHQSFVKKLVGEYMGADPRRGATYSWFLNHLQDSLGEIAPRSFVNLFENAARRQQDTGLPSSGQHLLEPQQIQGALDDVSRGRIAELTNEEYPWIKRIARCLEGQTVPMERKAFRRLLAGIEWDEQSRPLHAAPDRLIDYLVCLGILRETADHRIHVPDIYLYGFKLKRKGGIRRPKT